MNKLYASSALMRATTPAGRPVEKDAVTGAARLAVRMALAACAVAAAGCATVKVEAPDKPIEINLNVNIQQEVRVRLEREIEDLIADNPDIF